jgi:hypothetical protein
MSFLVQTLESLDRFSKFLSNCPAAERPHWLRQPLARYRSDSGRRDFLATEAAALAGSKGQSFREPVYVCGVGLVLKSNEHLQMHSAFQNRARVDAYGTLRAAPSSLSVSATLRLQPRAFQRFRDEIHE